jgi:tetratricopeptide (TPR) repeat protein
VALFDAMDAASHGALAPARLASQHWILGVAALLLGNVDEAVSGLRAALAAIREPTAQDGEFFLGGALPEVAILLWLERATDAAGLLEQAAICSEEAYALARGYVHAPTLTWSLQSRASALLAGGNTNDASDMLGELLELAQRFGIRPRVGSGRVLEGQLALLEGHPAQARARMEEGFSIWSAASPGLAVTSYAAAAARAFTSAGDLDAVSHFLSEGERTMANTEERGAEAELLRLRAWVAQQRGDAAEARSGLETAIALARHQGARVFALRACMDLVQLEQSGTAHGNALAMLGEAFGAFSEGFGTPLLREAATVLQRGETR